MLTINALICLAIALRMIAFQRNGSAHRPLAAALAYVLIVAAGSVFILTFFDQHGPVQAAQSVLNLSLLLAIVAARGNVVDLFRTPQSGNTWLSNLLRGVSWK